MFKRNFSRIGIYLGADYVAVSEAMQNSRTSTTFSEKKYELEGSSPGLETLLNNKDVMRQVISDVKDRIGSRYVKVNVAIAEPYLTSKVFEVSHDPKTQGNITDYLLWRFKNEFYVDVENKQLSYQQMSSDQGRYSILAQLCDKSLLRLLVDTFAVNKIAINSVDSSYSYVHNYLLRVCESALSSLFVHLGKSWIFASLDAEFNPVQIKSGWLESDMYATTDIDNELRNVFGKVERDTYSVLRKTGTVITSLPILHIVGSSNIDYKGIAKSTYSGECRILGDFINRGDYTDYVNGEGEFCVERVVASCQR